MNNSNLIQEIKTKLTIQQKVELFKELHKEISGKGVKGDTELAHINTFESRILRMFGGSGTINPETGLKQYFGGGGSGGGSAPADTTNMQTIREAPGIEERKLGLMDISRALAEKPVNIPAYQVSPFGSMEQQGITQSGVTGVGQAPVSQGITALQGVGTQAAQGATAAGFQNYLNPYQSYITDEINRQAAQQRTQIGAQAAQAGVLGGGREGVQLAESERARLQTIGQAQQSSFGQGYAILSNWIRSTSTGCSRRSSIRRSPATDGPRRY
jgi:hypothetical protein